MLYVIFRQITTTNQDTALTSVCVSNISEQLTLAMLVLT